MEVDRLELQRGKGFNLSESVQIFHPTLSEVVDSGYETYLTHVSTLTATSKDIADILWFEMQVWYEDIKDEWSFFVDKCLTSLRSETVKIFKYDILLKIETDCILVNPQHRDAINFFFKKEGEYIALKQNINNLPQVILFNAKYDDNGDLFVDIENSFKFTKFLYDSSYDFLMKMNWVEKDKLLPKAGNKRAKIYIMQQNYRKRKKKKGKKGIGLDSIVSSLIAHGKPSDDIWNYPIYLVYDQFYRLMKMKNYDNLSLGYYTGNIDTTKNPIKWDESIWYGSIE